MELEDKVRLVSTHASYSRYGDTIWTVKWLSNASNMAIIVADTEGASLFVWESEIVYVTNMFWECFACDLIIKLESKSRPTCLECGNLMSEVVGEV